MTAICGFISYDRSRDPLAPCQRMLDAQSLYGPHSSSCRASDVTAFGRALYRLLPQDDHDRQPLVGGGGRYLLAADLRLDNREALLASLGEPASRISTLSDSALLLACYERWGPKLVDHIAGDFAFALWDSAEHELLLARDPLGQRPLYFSRTKDHFAFASMPSGILALDSAKPAPDSERFADFLSDLRPSLDRSFFDGIGSVEPGHLLSFSNGAIRSDRYWNPSLGGLKLRSFGDYVEAYREQVDQAVRSCLRGADGAVASHLSSGYDSSAVTTTAARILGGSGGQVTAYTSAPRLGFDGLPARGRIADESGVAAITASCHANIEHVIMRPDNVSPVAAMQDMTPYAQQPLGNIKNAGWWTAINRDVSQRGISVLLTGENGNMSISAGGVNELADLVREGKWLTWLREAKGFKRNENVRWRGLLAASWGAWVPQPLWDLVVKLTLDEDTRLGTPFLLTAPLKERVAARSADEFWSSKPAADSRAVRLMLLRRQSHGGSRKSALARWGIDERDPTSDRRLLEFCLSLPTEMLIKDGVRRPLARAVLADRLPPQVLYPSRRGYQSADWYEHITREECKAVFESVVDCAPARSIIDMDLLGRLIDEWPTSDWHRPAVFCDYAVVLNALSSAYFIKLMDRGFAASGPVCPD
ncbi:MAG TPA: asparagine synthase-related protein [Allosphingosinicella sp.]|jgi:asparagine synthase (glutamine-hydrolysing)|uniref:asparagine synthetase B family protein n=1 Tax=Allosphingosinicella sp. TaxID=2823234 RepID=UPI002F29BE79